MCAMLCCIYCTVYTHTANLRDMTMANFLTPPKKIQLNFHQRCAATTPGVVSHTAVEQFLIFVPNIWVGSANLAPKFGTRWRCSNAARALSYRRERGKHRNKTAQECKNCHGSRKIHEHVKVLNAKPQSAWKPTN